MGWKYSVAVHGTQEQLSKFAKELEAIGYSPSHHLYPYRADYYLLTRRPKPLTTPGYDYFAPFHNAVQQADYRFSRSYNPRLALAIAAVHNDGVAHEGEYFMGDSGAVYKYSKGRLVCEFGSRTLGCGAILPTSFNGHKMTAEELIKYFRRVKPLTPDQCSETPPEGEGTRYKSLSDYFRDHSATADGTAAASKGKIIGYKSPFDLTSGFYTTDKREQRSFETVPAGTIYTPSDGMYVPKAGGTMLPPEIVERWEPMYEEKELAVIVDVPYTAADGTKPGVLSALITKSQIKCENLILNRDDLMALHAYLVHTPSIAGYSTTAEAFRIGCKHWIKRTDLERVLDTQAQLQKDKP